MATQMDRAKAWVGAAMQRARETGEAQHSKDWGYGDRVRCATIRYEDGSWQADLLCWGFPIRLIDGNYSRVSSEAIEALAGAG